MRRTVLVVLALILLGGARVQASYPLGIYAVLDKVVPEPNADAPERVQLWGDFAFPEGQSSFAFKSPVRGYLYYSLVKGKEDLCRREWNELKNAAGTGQCVAFSAREQSQGRLRKAGEEPKLADPYPISYGVFKIRDNNPVARELRSRPAPLFPAEAEQIPAGSITLRARNIYDTQHSQVKYIFELENGSGDKETSAPVAAGDKVTTWTPQRKVKPGEKYTWRVWATDGTWKGPVASASYQGKAVQ